MTICVGEHPDCAGDGACARLVCMHSAIHGSRVRHPLELMAIAGSAFVVNLDCARRRDDVVRGRDAGAVYVLLAFAFFFATAS